LGEDVGGADDYVLPPFDPPEVAARVAVTLQRSAALRGLNPLTGLPGNIVIGEEITRRLRRGDKFACLYIDLDHFKAYNDRYGFARGDDVIRALARCVVAALTEHGTVGCFAGHVGGDDFVVLTPPEEAEGVAKTMTERFTTEVYKLYEPAVRRRGWIEVSDRKGHPTRVPLCSVSVGIVRSDRGFETAAEMAEAAAEVKAIAKRDPGSSWAVDRRKAP
jgi:diguanylate cyclase (GGDEF)-like protein